jgi:hypothetical protein
MSRNERMAEWSRCRQPKLRKSAMRGWPLGGTLISGEGRWSISVIRLLQGLASKRT